MKRRLDGPKGYREEPDPYRTKTREGKTILCHACGLAASAVKKLRIIGCDACSHHFHLDCLDPPLVTPPPVAAKWVCPLHAHQTASSRQASKETNLTPIDAPYTPNNGDIDVILAPDNRIKPTQIEEISINRVKYQVPENFIILDFWAKLGKGKDISNTERLEANPAGNPSTTPKVERSVAPITSPSNPHPTPAAAHSTPIGFKCETPCSISRVSPIPTFLPPRAHFTPSGKSATKQSQLASLLQAARQADETQKALPDAGLMLLGNVASQQSHVPPHLRAKEKKSKPSSKPLSSVARTTTRASDPLRPRGSNRSTKSASVYSENRSMKESPKLKTPDDQAGPSLNLNQPFGLPPFNPKHVDVAASNTQVSSLDKILSCQNQIIASPLHAGCQWTGPRHISLGPARSTIFMGRGGPGIYLKSFGPTHDPACGGPGSAHGL